MDGGQRIAPGCGQKLQLRKVREGGFTEDKKQVFLDHLAVTCNVSASAKAAGVSTNTISYHRRRDEVFAERFGQAVWDGYLTLETMLMARSARAAKYQRGDTEVPDPNEMDTDLALNLIRLRRGPPNLRTNLGGPPQKRATAEELEAAILAKLEVLARRKGRKRTGASVSVGRGRRKGSRCPSGASGSTSSGRAGLGKGAGSSPSIRSLRQAQSPTQDERMGVVGQPSAQDDQTP